MTGSGGTSGGDPEAGPTEDGDPASTTDSEASASTTDSGTSTSTTERETVVEPPSERSSPDSRSRPDSRWWYAIAAVPITYAVSFLFGGVATIWALLLVLGAGMAPNAGIVVGGGISLLIFGALAVAAVTVLVTVLLPVALYFDTELVAEVDSAGWNPDRDLYVIAALAGLFVSGLSAAVALYYLYRRHVHLGVP